MASLSERASRSDAAGDATRACLSRVRRDVEAQTTALLVLAVLWGDVVVLGASAESHAFWSALEETKTLDSSASTTRRTASKGVSASSAKRSSSGSQLFFEGASLVAVVIEESLDVCRCLLLD